MSFGTSLIPYECTWAGLRDDETQGPMVSAAPGDSQPTARYE